MGGESPPVLSPRSEVVGRSAFGDLSDFEEEDELLAKDSGDEVDGVPDALELGSFHSFARAHDLSAAAAPPTTAKRPSASKAEPAAAPTKPTAVPTPPSSAVVLWLVGGHALSASLLLVVNRWALQAFPFIWILTTLQFLPAALLVWLAGVTGTAQVETLSWNKLVAFGPGAGMFLITIAAGNAVVQHSNVDTFIVMRSLVPIPCAFLESLVLKEPCPRPASWLGLCSLLAGAVCYASVNQGVTASSSSWMLLYLVTMPAAGVLIKHLINVTGLSEWGLVLYQNTAATVLGLACTATFELGSAASRASIVEHLRTGGFSAILPVVLSAVVGVSVSYFQMSVRKVISSTAFMVLGVSNKLLALLISQLAMEANGSLFSIGSVLLSVGGAVGFQQTVKGKGVSQAPDASSSGSPEADNTKTYLAMLVGLTWAAYLTYSEQSPDL